MAIDMDAIRKKLGQLSGTNSRKEAMWRPEEGKEATIRVVAWPDNDGQPFKERWFYYNIGDNYGLLTPNQFNKPDPIQELINKLREDGKPNSYELAKKLYPSMRSYALVLVRGEEEKGLRVWGFGKTVYQNFLKYMLDEDYGDITDFETGNDIRVTNEKPAGKTWATTEIRPRVKKTPIHDDLKQVRAWIENAPDIDDLYDLKTYDELEKIVNDWLNPSDESESSDESDESDDSSDSVKESKSTSKFKNLEDAFEGLKDLD